MIKSKRSKSVSKCAMGLAEAADVLFNDGVMQITAEDIVNKKWSCGPYGTNVPTPGMLSDAQKYLPQIRLHLEEQYLRAVYLLSKAFFTGGRDGRRFRNMNLADFTDEDARRCVPGGPGNGAWGLGLHVGKGDPIWKATQQMLLNPALSKTGNIVKNAASEVRKGMLSEIDASEIITPALHVGEQLDAKDRRTVARVLGPAAANGAFRAPRTPARLPPK